MSKYSVAKEVLAQLVVKAEAAGVDPQDAMEALLVSAIADFGKQRGGEYAKSFLQYEVDSLSSSGVTDIQRR